MELSQIHIRDPFILPFGGKYYMYGTRGAGCWSESSQSNAGFDVYVSDDLKVWSEARSVFERTDGFWADRNFWAPEVHYRRGSFYMLASFYDGKRHRGTQLLKSDTPDGVFAPITKYPVTPADWACLDGTLYTDLNGGEHIVFCHEWTQITDGAVCEAALSEDLSRAASEPRTLFHGSEPYWARKKAKSWVTDGPFLHRGESGRLYMIWSSFTDSGYVQAQSYSDNGDIDGVWKHDLPLIREKNGGHGMIFKGFDERLYLVLHSPNDNPHERPTLMLIEERDGALRLV